ncbi:hypothetical protein ACFL1S_03640 [Pseudomonadota bacterium]
MTTISSRIESDADFRTALGDLTVASQRQLGKRFVDHIIELTDSSKVNQAMAYIDEIEASSEQEIADAYRMVKAAAIESYTLCGNEGDWRKQAAHFVAAAAAACLSPQPGRGGDLAWSTAMNARMARLCDKIAEGAGDDNNEAKDQYRILESFLNLS